MGRLDILAVDNDNNYYVIELKKDTGYGDVYEQTLRYMDWIENNMAKKPSKVYGIICLSSPDQELVEKVKKHPMLCLYEYGIEYRRVV